MHRLSDADLLRTWERGHGASPAARGLLLLAAAFPDRDPDELAALPIGRRDCLLLDLRKHVFGPRVEAVVRCPNCGAPLELECQIDDFRCEAPAAESLRVTVAGLTLAVRLPDSLDLLHAAAAGSVVAARRVLFERCVSPPPGVPVAELPEEAIVTVASAIAATDPQSATTLELTCSECAAAAAVPYDAVQFFWRELQAWAARTFHEIHTLAAAYGWTEDAILALSARRRRVYLDLVSG